MNTNCKAVRANDQYQCGACGLFWDIDDNDAPECSPVRLPRTPRNDSNIQKLKRALDFQKTATKHGVGEEFSAMRKNNPNLFKSISSLYVEYPHDALESLKLYNKETNEMWVVSAGDNLRIQQGLMTHDNQPYGEVIFQVDHVEDVVCNDDSDLYLKNRVAQGWVNLRGRVVQGGVKNRMFEHVSITELRGTEYSISCPRSAFEAGRYVTTPNL